MSILKRFATVASAFLAHGVTSLSVRSVVSSIDVISELGPGASPSPSALLETLSQLLRTLGMFSTFNTVLEAAGLTLSDSDHWWVFVPTQKVLDQFLKDNNVSSLPKDVIQNVLLYHVGVVSPDQPNLMQGSNIISMANNQTTNLTLDGSKLFINGIPVIEQIDAANGRIFVIDGVLEPPQVDNLQPITQILLNDPQYQRLVNAVVSAGLEQSLISGNFTIFAPRNQAFDNLTSIPSGKDLANVLSYHVIDKSVDINTLKSGDKLTTLQGKDVTLTKTGDQWAVNGVPIVSTTKGSNGYVYAINQVLSP